MQCIAYIDIPRFADKLNWIYTMNDDNNNNNILIWYLWTTKLLSLSFETEKERERERERERKTNVCPHRKWSHWTIDRSRQRSNWNASDRAHVRDDIPVPRSRALAIDLEKSTTDLSLSLTLSSTVVSIRIEKFNYIYDNSECTSKGTDEQKTFLMRFNIYIKYKYIIIL